MSTGDDSVEPTTDAGGPALDSVLLEVARTAAQAGAAVLMRYFGRGLEASETKSTGTDMVSEADLGAEAAIRAVIAEHRPQDLILGEEGGLAHADGTPVAGNEAGADGEVYGKGAVAAARDAAGSGLVWICDPLDGTTNFLYGLRSWCVSVAVRDAEGTIVGCVVDPLAQETWLAGRGGLAMLIDRHGAVNPLPDAGGRATPLGRALIGTGYAYAPAVRRHQAQVIAGYIDIVRDIRRTGAAALDLCWAAAGRLDAYYERTVRPWDVAAGALLCEQVGLDVRWLPPVDGVPDGVIATPQVLTQPLWDLVAAGAEPATGAVIDLVR